MQARRNEMYDLGKDAVSTKIVCRWFERIFATGPFR